MGNPLDTNLTLPVFAPFLVYPLSQETVMIP
jgi:hypothetical protein